MVRFTIRPLYPRGKNPGSNLIGGWLGPRAGLEAVAKRKIPALVGKLTRVTKPAV